MIKLPRKLQLLVMLLAVASARPATAQNIVDWIVTTGNWDTGANWSSGLPPDLTFDETANISNGGTATVNSLIGTQPGQIILGRLAGQTGALTIANNGNLTAAFFPGNVSNGGVNVGQAGAGVLTVQPGGSLAARTITVANTAGSSATFGGAGALATTITTEFGTTFGRELRVIGPNVNFTTQTLILQGSNRYTAQITGAAHSAIKSGNLASIGGTLRVEFNGVTPTLGNKWNLIDAPAIGGAFAAIDVSAAPVLPFGQRYRFHAVPDVTSANGVYGQLSVDQLLVLNVDRSTGATSIRTGPGNVAIDGYTIASAGGALAPANWNSLQAQGVSNWRRSPQNGSVTRIAELKPTGSTAVTSVAPFNLGNLFQYPTPAQFGTELEDLTFEYFTPGGAVEQGIINYTGNKRFNNLVLMVNPFTGQARIENQSTLSVNIDGYRITSASDSLLSANGTWNSLDDQNAAGGDWRESAPDAGQLAELKPSGSTPMVGSAALSIGSPFKSFLQGGDPDLVFEYLFPGDENYRQGGVVYLTADFNGDKVINGLDLAVLKASFGLNAGGDADGDRDTDGTDYLLFQRQVGLNLNTVVTASAAVPEPGCLALAVLAAAPLLRGWRREKLSAAASR